MVKLCYSLKILIVDTYTLILILFINWYPPSMHVLQYKSSFLFPLIIYINFIIGCQGKPVIGMTTCNKGRLRSRRWSIFPRKINVCHRDAQTTLVLALSNNGPKPYQLHDKNRCMMPKLASAPHSRPRVLMESTRLHCTHMCILKVRNLCKRARACTWLIRCVWRAPTIPVAEPHNLGRATQGAHNYPSPSAQYSQPPATHHLSGWTSARSSERKLPCSCQATEWRWL